jgi:hypothetical protein
MLSVQRECGCVCVHTQNFDVTVRLVTFTCGRFTPQKTPNLGTETLHSNVIIN